MKKLPFFLLFLLIAGMSCTQRKPQINATEKISSSSESNLEVLTGKLIAKSWAKSPQSYCAQGSGYHVLAIGDKEHVLEIGATMMDRLKGKVGKTVSLKGNFVTRRIEHDVNDGLQHPVGGPDGDNSFECTVFSVTALK